MKELSEIDESELEGIHNEIIELRNLARKVMDNRTQKSMFTLLKDKRVKPTKIVGHLNYVRVKDDASTIDVDAVVLAVSTFYNLIMI
jgi:hypothetical protein